MRLFYTLRGALLALAFLFTIGGLFAQADLSLSLTQPATPQQYTFYSVTATIVNDGPEDATNVAISLPLVGGVVYQGGNEFTASLGSFSPYGNQMWTLPIIEAGATETLIVNYFLRVASVPNSYAQVMASDQVDPDSTPGNGTPPTAGEDDEASTLINGGFVPDLTLSNLTVLQNPVDSGQQIDFTFDINNIGAGSIGQNFLVQAYISTDATISADDLQNGTVPTGNFDPGQTVAGVVGASLPIGLSPGNYFLILEADANGQVLESNETNNTIFVPLTIEASTPTVCEVAIATSTITCDDNGTPQDPSDDIARIEILATNSGGTSFTVASSTGTQVAAGDYGVAVTFTLPLFNNQNSALEYVVLDDTAPATCSATVALTSPTTCSPNGPDLQVSALQLDPAGIQANGDLGFTFDLTNAGATGIAQTFLVQAFLSVDSLLSSDDIQNGTVPTGGFGPAQTVSGVVGASNVSALTPGDYYLILFADANRQVAETLEDNNTSNAVLFTIPAPVSCEIAISSISEPTCTDMGTPNDPSDDQGSVSIVVSNTSATGSFYDIFDSAGNNLGEGEYGQVAGLTIDSLQSNQGTTIQYTLVDRNDPTCALPFSVVTPAPCSNGGGTTIDLAVSITQSPSQPTQYSLYSITATVTNSGMQTATGIVLNLPIPAGVVYEGGNEFTATQGQLRIFGSRVGQWTVGTIPAGQNAEITINYFLRTPTIPESYVEVLAANEQDADSTPGNGNGQVNEDDEASTLINGGFVPDITLTNLMLAQNAIDSGAQVDFTVDINNIGLGSIGQNFLVQAYISTDNVLSSDDLQNGTIPTGNFAGGQTVAGVMGAAIPVGLSPGNYFLILEADANRQVLESNENNNLISVPFTINAVVNPVCNISALVQSVGCDAQGTPNDDTDDTYSVTFLIENGGATGTWTGDDGGANSSFSGSYGVPFTLQGGNVLDAINLGGLTLSINITDDLDASCVTSLTWQTPGATCSSTADPCDAVDEFQAFVPAPVKATVSDDEAGNFTVNYTAPNGASNSFTFDAVAALGVTPVQLNTVSSRDIICKSNNGFAVAGVYRDIVDPGFLRPFIIQLDASGNVTAADVIVFANPNLDVNSFLFIDSDPNGGAGDVFYAEIFTGSRSYFIAAFDEANSVLWESQAIGDLVTNKIRGTVLSNDKSRLYLSYRDGNSSSWPRLRGINVTDGTTDWEVRLGDLTSLPTTLPITGDPSAPLLTANDEVVVGINVRGLNSGQGTLRYGVRVDRDGNVVYLAQQPSPLTNSFDSYVPEFESSTGAIVFSGIPATVVMTAAGTTVLCSNNQIDLELTAISANQQPQQYTTNSITFTLTNDGPSTATGILVDVIKPNEVVYTGGNEFTASQGTYSPRANPDVWDVGSLAAGESATLVVNYFVREAGGFLQRAEVSAADQVDVDSTPGNASGVQEDDEVLLNLNFAVVQALTFFPNPLPQGEQIILDFVSSGETTQTVIFSDLTGRPVQTVQVAFQEGRNQIPVELGLLPAGVYVVAFPESGLLPKRIIIQE
jgi:hypothetical protein